MPPTSLQDVIDSTDDLVQMMRDRDLEASIWDYPDKPYDFPKEFTHWAREQQAWREDVALVDQSFHMTHMSVKGDEDDAIDLFESLAVNSFQSWRDGEPPGAKQYVVCNPDGYVIGDCIIFWLEEGHFLFVGEEPTHNWTNFHAEKGDYDVECEHIYNPLGPNDPTYFRFELMGPKSMDLAGDIVDGGFPGIHFFQMDEFSVNGVDVYALGHQMTSEKGFEIFGPYEHHDDVLDYIFEEGEKYDLHQVGNKAYVSTGPELAWIPLPLPAIYEHPDLQEYREWLPVETLEANFALGGSHRSDDVTDYYATLGAMGYTHIANFDHDFVGKEAVREEVEDPTYQKVTVIFDDEDVERIQNSIFDEGDTYQFMQIPDIPFESSISRYDSVVDEDGGHIGMCKHPSYNYNQRELPALAWVETEYAEPGTRVTIEWGEPECAKTQGFPNHVLTDIQATVKPAPYIKTDRQDM